MVTFEVFLAGLLLVSMLTSLVTEAIKKLMSEYEAKPKSNTLAAIAATVLSVLLGIGYGLMTNADFNVQYVISVLALSFLSWLCSMVGYDKVVAILQSLKR